VRRPSILSAAFWREGGAEGVMLRAVFYGLLTASLVMLATDFNDLAQRAAEFADDGGPTEPVTVEPVKERDQERPYFPRTMPLAPFTTAPQLPGIPVPTTSKMLAAPMRFAVDEAGKISAVGRIEPGTAQAFAEFLKENGRKAKSVWLNSPGGSVPDALAMGRAIRTAGLATVVPANAYCASSCPLAFVGGIEREAGRKAWIGVHQIYTLPGQRGSLGEGLAQAQRMSAECQQYLVEMGIDARAWIPAMRTPKSKLYVFTPKELNEFRLVTKTAT
jgi:hypothetical protein